MIVPTTGLLFLSLSHSGDQAAGPSDDASVVGKLEGALRVVAAVEQVIRLGEGRADGLQLAVEPGDLLLEPGLKGSIGEGPNHSN